MADRLLAQDCAQHARLFFGSADLRLDMATHGSFTLSPSEAMHDALARDYEAMSGMIFGPFPAIDEVLHAVAQLEQHLNTNPT